MLKTHTWTNPPVVGDEVIIIFNRKVMLPGWRQVSLYGTRATVKECGDNETTIRFSIEAGTYVKSFFHHWLKPVPPLQLLAEAMD